MEQKRLYRSRINSIFGGVCGGLGDYFGMDPVIIRALFAIAFFAGGGGLLVYIVLWIVTPLQPYPWNSEAATGSPPEQPKPQDEPNPGPFGNEKPARNKGSLWAGLILIVVGSIFLVDRFISQIRFEDFWPLILVAVGAVLIINTFQKPRL
jgi:phage shock protein C